MKRQGGKKAKVKRKKAKAADPIAGSCSIFLQAFPATTLHADRFDGVSDFCLFTFSSSIRLIEQMSRAFGHARLLGNLSRLSAD
jgi:hypothetical protein